MPTTYSTTTHDLSVLGNFSHQLIPDVVCPFGWYIKILLEGLKKPLFGGSLQSNFQLSVKKRKGNSMFMNREDTEEIRSTGLLAC